MEREAKTEGINWKDLSPYQAARAVWGGYADQVGGLASIAANLIQSDLASAVVVEINSVLDQEPEDENDQTEEAIRKTAQRIKEQVAEKIKNALGLGESDEEDMAENLFALWERKVAQELDKAEKGGEWLEAARKDLETIGLVWQNLLRLADPERPIDLPLQESTTTGVEFNFTAPLPPLWQELDEEEIKRALISSFIDQFGNNLMALLINLFPEEEKPGISHNIGSLNQQETRVPSKEEVIRKVANAIKTKVEEAVALYLKDQESRDSLEALFSKIEEAIKGKTDEERKTQLTVVLEETRTIWQNLLILTNPEQPISLPCRRADVGALPKATFDFKSSPTDAV